jgi:hypothetical protein
MENAFVDISVEYEWFHNPPMTIDDIKGTDDWIVVGPWKRTLTIKKPFTERYLATYEGTYMNETGGSYEGIKKISYNGEFTKFFELGGLPDNTKHAKLSESLNGNGIITNGKQFMSSIVTTPIGFSVFRFTYDGEEIPLYELLRGKEKVIVKIDSLPAKINDFNSIRADIFAPWNKQFIIYRIYFAVDYGYTPIRYGYGPDNSLMVDVTSLQEVQKGLWFPSSGLIISTDPNYRTNGFRATDKILVNQGLKDEDFDIELPPGTKVQDHITGKMYTIKPTQQQVDQSAPK